MQLEAKVFPNSKKDSVKKENRVLKIYTNSPAVEGKANKKALELTAEFFGIKKSKVKIVKGIKSRNKILEVEE